MQFKVTITTDNAAFDCWNGNEIGRILQQLAAKIDGCHLDDGYRAILIDSNGNVVGEATHD